MKKILMLNGPNLNMLGIREPDVYGHMTLDELDEYVRAYAAQRDVELTCFQSNHEGELIDKIHVARKLFGGIIYNPGAHTHYSYALRDAVASIDIPVVEVHLTDIEQREDFRRVSVIAPECVAQIRGMGVDGYYNAVDLLIDNNEFDRLGEGFEKNFKPEQLIRIGNISQL